ncbi:hypothetical protein [Dactylosporangium roseum]|uniref:hypothetical protein n=1 Tax=Dactylosporangium roseum TaxID=47989 RepID=UPI0036F38119
MRGDAVRQAFVRARTKVGMPGFRFHDLRHTGQTLAASTGATVKDLMRRLGHASPVASYRYLHAVDGRDAEIASALSELAAHGTPQNCPGRSLSSTDQRERVSDRECLKYQSKLPSGNLLRERGSRASPRRGSGVGYVGRVDRA